MKMSSMLCIDWKFSVDFWISCVSNRRIFSFFRIIQASQIALIAAWMFVFRYAWVLFHWITTMTQIWCDSVLALWFMYVVDKFGSWFQQLIALLTPGLSHDLISWENHSSQYNIRPLTVSFEGIELLGDLLGLSRDGPQSFSSLRAHGFVLNELSSCWTENSNLWFFWMALLSPCNKSRCGMRKWNF